MKNIKNSVLGLGILAIIIVVSAYAQVDASQPKKECQSEVKTMPDQTINMFVTHGHCSTPFAGEVNDLNVHFGTSTASRNPLEGMQISFTVDPNTFNVCSGEEYTERIKTPGLFIDENNTVITFKSTEVYTMGLDWFQVNGKMGIKGVERDVKLFVTAIRDPKELMASSIVVSGQMDLWDWGIDYDKIVNGKSDDHPTKWLHLNMRIDL